MNEVRYEYDVLSVGDADAILIRQYIDDEPYIVLIDAGNAGDADKIKDHLRDYYKSYYIDLAICTHPDSDHKDGFFKLLLDEEITINTFWLIDPAEYLDVDDLLYYRNPVNVKRAVRKIWQKSTDANLNLYDLASQKCAKVVSVIDGSEYSILPISIVGPTKEYYNQVVKDMVVQYGVNTYKESSKEAYDEAFKIDEEDIKSVIDKVEDQSPYNASSLIVLYEPGDGKRLIFAGDANTISLQMMLEKHEWLRNVDLLKVPHHGSHRNLNTSIIDELSPGTSIISAAGNDEHPSGQLVYWLAKYGDVYSTHKCNSYIHYQYGNMPQRENTISVEPLKRKT
jgi:beta-lactamase superfamily II metal-dependent hydrolase